MSVICRDNSKGHPSPMHTASQVDDFFSKDDGPLSTMNSLGRIGVSDRFCDIGEYLCYLFDENKFDSPTRNIVK